ncbi:uncharacterized protein PHACADRAFT_209785 [Phanerochaete carnosa HHB-10118-sp]|uniref:Uncharacterized protein n=1 Tax=Phanerochaete carnosa (strain HHB-10118-sp) TaxID=650164 RepID=K5W4T6_PHACS|nr:uncharacterized protein PHACADRAFT_209785 [Phanerochaete carnosa HHB-10118-sp]EKM53954.1 hypothetical protein PHACADRAFT_209785 [Phanerochaete carnosa HHB-10118-sp]
MDLLGSEVILITASSFIGLDGAACPAKFCVAVLQLGLAVISRTEAITGLILIQTGNMRTIERKELMAHVRTIVDDSGVRDNNGTSSALHALSRRVLFCLAIAS